MELVQTPQIEVIHQKQAEEIKYLHINDIMQIVNSEDSQYWKMLFVFLFETGCRITEGLNVKFEDIMFYENKVKIITLKQRKPAFRLLKMSSELTKLLMIHKSENYMLPTDYILAKKSGKNHVTNPAIWYRLRKVIREALGSSKESFGHSHSFVILVRYICCQRI